MDSLAQDLLRYLAGPDPATGGSNELFARLASEKPVIRIGATWIISRYDLVAALASHPRCVLELPGEWQNVAGVSAEAAAIARRLLPVQPPAEHRRLRRLVSAQFSSRSAAEMGGQIRDIVDGLFTGPLQHGHCELVADIAVPLPVFTNAALLGIPAHDWKQVLGWGTALNGLINQDTIRRYTALRQAGAAPSGTAPPEPRASQDVVTSASAVTRYVEDLISRRQEKPGPDLVSRLAAQAETGDGVLTHDELTTLVLLLFMTGLDTVGSTLVNVVMALLRHADAWQRVVADPSLAGRAYTEAARLYPALPMMSRSAAADIELSGLTIPAGATIMLVYGAANLDPAAFPDPLRFDMDRDGARPMTFGHGPHYCLGAALALMQGEAVLRKLAESSPGFTLLGEPGPRRPEFAFHSVSTLPLRLGAHQREPAGQPA
ncbi:MAG TPA: cytochrome P450 [Streptosporangiaceae bacterium]|nr:cytochrome P450 [Streptosporangiaceae bacterium]